MKLRHTHNIKKLSIAFVYQDCYVNQDNKFLLFLHTIHEWTIEQNNEARVLQFIKLHKNGQNKMIIIDIAAN